MSQRISHAGRVVLLAATLLAIAFSGAVFAKPCAGLIDDCHGIAPCSITCDAQWQPSLAAEAPQPCDVAHGTSRAVAARVIALDGTDLAPDVPPPRAGVLIV